MNDLSIIIVNWNTRDLLKKCIDTLRLYTDFPHELILVDNGSRDGSVEMIKSLTDENTKSIFLPENLGFSGGNNRGIEISTGQYVCLINSDAFVTFGWIKSMIKCMRSKGAGMVGPWTNKCKGKQRHKEKYLMIPKWLRPSREVDFLSFFCVLIDRRVFDTIGLLDEGFDLGMYEDDDFCRRARAVGFRLFIDEKSWVWHEAHATMKANRIDIEKTQQHNLEKYTKKWLK